MQPTKSLDCVQDAIVAAEQDYTRGADYGRGFHGNTGYKSPCLFEQRHKRSVDDRLASALGKSVQLVRS